jgi:hypothetical protein
VTITAMPKEYIFRPIYDHPRRGYSRRRQNAKWYLRTINPPTTQTIRTSAGLLVLGAGFVSLGALSFIKRHLEDTESGLLLNSAYPIIGSLISILLGFAFFAIALLFVATRLKERKSCQLQFDSVLGFRR